MLLLVGTGLILRRSSTLKDYIQAFTVTALPAANVLLTDDIKQLADGEEVVVSVYIDEKEFKEALDDLTNVDQEG